jgi:hypothetical protein
MDGMQSLVGLQYGTSRAFAQGYWADGTLALPGGAFLLDKDNGVRRITTDSWSLVAGGVDSMLLRKGTKLQQFSMGNLGGAWTAADGQIFHIHHQTTGSDGDVGGFVAEITAEASSGGAGAVPDSSATGGIIYQTSASADGAIRSADFHTFRLHASAGANANSSAIGIEVGIHTLATGNATFGTTGGGIPKTMGIFLGSYYTGGVAADCGLYLFGTAGFRYPIFYHDPSSNIGFYVNSQGNVRITTNNNATSVGYGFVDDENSGIYWGGNGAVALAGEGIEIARTYALSSSFGALRLGTGFELANPISPTQLAANTDNYSPTNYGISTVWRLSTDASRNLTGIAAPSGNAPKVLVICNVGAQNLVLKHDVTSTNANRFLLPNSVDLTLLPNMSTIIWYDATSARWRCLSGFVS